MECTHTDPVRATPELLEEMHRVIPNDPEHLRLEIELGRLSADIPILRGSGFFSSSKPIPPLGTDFAES